MKKRRTFSESFAEGLRVSAAKRGWRAFVPYVLFLSVAIASLAVYHIPRSYWADDNLGVSATVYVGFVTFNALLLAFSQSAFLKIQDTLSGSIIGQTLARQDLLDETLFSVELNQAILVVSAATSAIGLVSVITPLNIIADRVIFCAALTLSFYALVKAYVATREMNEFIWEHIHSQIDGASPLSTIPFPSQQGNGGR